ncbi:MAG: phosphate ABC transporter substrate-binding protein PstS [Coleofasciculus sp. B1-GNL1-01]|uniref:phosphate ABC transporter substrate-binding protein PstS n=1 Tax=Coleofasciculus sp. B1-GNL1-01 TaxID=3068484 RepID=UPI0032F55402
MKTFTFANWSKFIAVTLTATTIPLTISAVSAQVLKGFGASFPEPLYQRYSTEYEKETGKTFEYTAIGSGGGIRKFMERAVDFGATTLIPTPIEENQVEDGLLMVPTGGGAVAIVYNLKDVPTNIKLSREQLAKIFTGQIGNWKQVNPRFPNKEIQVIVRSDSSGATFVLTKYLNKISGGKIEASREPDWGFDIFAARPQDSGVAAEVRRIDGAIGYVQSGVAQRNNLPVARLENQAGRYVKPTLAETKKALANVTFNQDFTTDNINDPEEGYPLVSLTWLLIYKRYPNQTLVQDTQDVLRWIMTRGQELNQELEYTRIPEDVAQKVIERVNTELKVRPY